MPKFHVIRKEVFDQIVEIDADDREEALELVVAGNGDEIGESEYHHTLDPDVWNCEEVKPSTKTIKLSCYGIVLNLVWDDHTEVCPCCNQCAITSDLKDVCPCCNQADCYLGCDGSQSDLPESTESEDDVDGRKKYNAAMDGIESMILGHAVAGVDIEEPAYLEGIEAAVQACGNHFS